MCIEWRNADRKLLEIKKLLYFIMGLTIGERLGEETLVQIDFGPFLNGLLK